MVKELARLNRDVAGCHLCRRIFYTMNNDYGKYNVETFFPINGRTFRQSHSYKNIPTLKVITEDFIKEFEWGISIEKNFYNNIHFAEETDNGTA